MSNVKGVSHEHFSAGHDASEENFQQGDKKDNAQLWSGVSGLLDRLTVLPRSPTMKTLGHAASIGAPLLQAVWQASRLDLLGLFTTSIRLRSALKGAAAEMDDIKQGTRNIASIVEQALEAVRSKVEHFSTLTV